MWPTSRGPVDPQRPKAQSPWEAKQLPVAVVGPAREVAADYHPFASVRGEFLDSAIHCIRDVKAIVAIQRDPVRKVETASFSSFPSHPPQVFPVIRELLDAVVGSTHPDPILPVHAQ